LIPGSAEAWPELSTLHGHVSYLPAKMLDFGLLLSGTGTAIPIIARVE
jgi:hypothetical protein